MRAVFAQSIHPNAPLDGLAIGERPEPQPQPGWEVVKVVASALNHHDIWSLRGVGLSEAQLPMILGCDAVAVREDGTRVLVHAVIPDAKDPRGFSLLSEKHQGTLADYVTVPAENLLPLPAGVSTEDAAALPTAWLTAYRMLTTKGRVQEAESVLVQGAGGGVATAAVVLAHAMGKRVYATSRDAAKREKIAALGAIAVESGARLPERVDVVIETVGPATFDHSLKCAAPGARIVVSGSTSGRSAELLLARVFMMELQILGSSMGTAGELRALIELVATGQVKPVIDEVLPFADVRQAFEKLATGDVFGKLVLTHS
ncbi:MAG: zinc-binding dehydrogenase [Hamadaea sp.]|uniref:zinc-binding dehydrogenase n=1 Tax=Hamadaea sp. TaxID=2024425 RepID=UPI00183C8C57|nr:zinc-binding dehydrogenase [Hamadaea sp.]NUT22645.1 zinc-binding dehydrogenase [Hamadaea sp.]